MPEQISTYTKTAYEIFEDINKLKTKDERVAALHEASKSDMIAELIVYAFNDHIRDLNILPDSVPTQKESNDDENGMYLPALPESVPSSLSRQVGGLRAFIRSPANPKPSIIKSERAYLGLLETVHPKDAELVANIMAGVWPYKKISASNISEARPDLVRKPDWMKK